MADQFVQHEHIVITSAEIVHMMSDPMRIRIGEALSDPHTVKELATIFEVPVTRLYYHINLMEKHGIIQVVDTQIVSGLVEKKYQLIARNFSIDGNIFDADPKIGRRVDEIIGALFENTRRQLRLLVSKRQAQSEESGEPQSDRIKVDYSMLALSPTELDIFEDELDKLLERYAHNREDQSPDSEIYSLTSVLYPNIEADEFTEKQE